MIPTMRLTCLIVVCALVVPSPIHGQHATGSAPTAFDVTEKSIEDLQKAMQDKQVTAQQLVDQYLVRIDAYDQRGPALNAIVVLNPRAREQAMELDRERQTKGARGPLHGVPVLVKDNYETIEMPTAAGSVALAAFHPKRDATLVRRLKEAGAVILGKTTMHELAHGITTVGSGFGQTRNPYDLDRTPGGSSGGTGAAVAANFAAAGMGSDTCGSIRIPAANNNLVGLRGTQGLSSRTGIVPLSSTQDIGGPIARSIADLAILLDATIGQDATDPSTMIARTVDADEDEQDRGRRSDFRRNLDAKALAGARLGVARSLFGTTPDDQEVTTIVNRALEALKKAGAEVIDVTIPGVDDLLRDSSMIASDFKFDFMEYLAKSDDAPVKSLDEILRKGLFHSALESALRARNAPAMRETDAARRARVKQAALRAVTASVLDEQRLAAIVYPTLRRRPARIGDAQGGTNCSLSAHSGLPALSVPAGFTTDDVPIGMELLGAAWSEQTLLSLGYAIEHTLKARQAPFSTPPLVAGRIPAVRTTRATGLGTTVALSYDETTSRLRFEVTPGAKTQTLGAIWIHSGTRESVGAARHLLLSPLNRQVRTGEVTLSAGDRRDLREGRLSLGFYPTGRGERVTVHLAEVRAWK
jgi:Asp-tRNA(Asn)/Glu-tRNA(Gln) amidotransferase A subunit family amidase